MNNIEFEKTNNLPYVSLNTNGNFTFEGRITAEDTSSFFEPLMQWLESVPLNNVVINVKLDYINTSASKYLFSFIKAMEGDENIQAIKVNWYFEEDDDNVFDMGKYFETSLKRSMFHFMEISCEDHLI